MFVGELMWVVDGKFDNLTQIRRNERRRLVLEKVDPDTTLKFSPSEKVEHIVYVFTDVDDVYSQRFHRDLNSYMSDGIEIRYLAYPSTGVQSDEFKKMVSVWCSKDPKKALSKSMRGDRIEFVDCPNPVTSHYDLGQEMYVTRVPSIVLETGLLIPVYKDRVQLKKIIIQELQAFEDHIDRQLIDRIPIDQ